MEVTQARPARDYWVEVSGWGPGAEFFRECVTLRESDNRRLIIITHPVNAGAMIFVRPAGFIRDPNLFPIVFHAEAVSLPDSGGRREVSLVPVQ